MAKAKKSKYYAVRVGRKTGIYRTWGECQEQIMRYPGAVYKSFTELEDAENFMTPPTKEDINGLPYAYVDGSYDKYYHVYGYGGFLITETGEKHVLQGGGYEVEMASMHNVAGEILGAMAAVKKAEALNIPKLVLYYDYEGIEQWATGSWKRNKNGTKEYYAFMQDTNVEIVFVKVKGHSGVEGNEEADALAKGAVAKTIEEAGEELKPVLTKKSMKIDVVAKQYYTVTLSKEDIKKVKRWMDMHGDELEGADLKEKICEAVTILHEQGEIDIYQKKKAKQNGLSTEKIEWSELEKHSPEDILGVDSSEYEE